MGFSESQNKAITHEKGPMMVLAGPGSGKTLVIINRTRYLIEQCGISPSNILVITFTKAAALEMQERFSKLMGQEYTGVAFGTFHAIFFKILKYAYNYSAANIITEEERYRLLREVVLKLKLEIEDEKEFLEGISAEISLVKSEMMDLANYYSMNCSEQNFSSIYKAYETGLRNKNKIDFDDMLVLCYELLKERPDILALWQKKYRYILIDEFQDINRIQFEIIRMLAKPEDNLFIVGDDDQSIYRFRGAKPEIMLSFKSLYENAKQVVLDRNFRSGENIVKAALAVVKNNTKRFDKKITAQRKTVEPLKLKVFSDLSEENQEVVNQILACRKKGVSYSEIAVLYRTNTQPSALINKLMEYNIPFHMRDTIPNIYEHWIAKDILAYIRLAKGERDRSLLLQILNRPKRYIGRECLEEKEISFASIKNYYKDKPYVVERIDKLEYDLALLKKVNPYAAINYIRRAIGYDEYLKEYAAYRRLKPEELLDTLSELQENARDFKTYDEWFAHMEEFKENLKKQMLNHNKNKGEGVMMTTFHGSKGLEYKVVFIIDANEEITPHKKAVMAEDMEEERRMFYVAMTRAKDVLYIFSVKERYNKELYVSRFVSELSCDKDLLVNGQRVIHKTYGSGVITRIEKDRITIQFDKETVPKVMNLKFITANRLIKIEE